MKYDYRIDRDDAGRLAYAYRMLGDTETSNYLLSLYDRPDSDYWGYRIALADGDLPKQVLYLEKLASKQNKTFEEVLSLSTLRSVSEYHRQQHEHLQVVNERQHIIGLLTFVILLVLAFFTNGLLIRRKHLQQESYENLLSTLRYANSCLEKQQNEQERKFIDLYRDKFTVINELYFLQQRASTKDPIHQDFLLQKISEMFSSIVSEGQLAAVLDQDLDNLIQDLRSEVELCEQDVLLVCLLVIKLDTRIISCMMNLGISNIYTRKSRIVKKIESLEGSSKSKYLQYLR